MELRSPAFQQQGTIPEAYTCEGENRPPPLTWQGAPAGTRSFALIVDDPDAPDPKAPKRTFVHWVVFNIPSSASALQDALPEGALQGRTDFGAEGYGGPCPPIGRHRYFFKLYALDTELALEHPTKKQLEGAMEGHVLARAELMGTYMKHA